MLIYPNEMQMIKNHPYFAGFESESDIKWLLQCCEAYIETAQAGEIIAEEGEEVRFLPVILSGNIDVSAMPPASEEISGLPIPVREWTQIESQSGLSHTIIAVIPPAEIKAKDECTVLRMKVMRALTPCGRKCPFHARFVENL